MNWENNLAYGLDGIFRLFGDDYLNVKWSQTYDSQLDNTLGSLDPSFFLANWQRRSEKGFSYDLKYIYSGQEFNPGIGFVRMEAVQGFNTNLRYGWFPGEASKLFDYAVGMRIERFSRLEDGGLESMIIAPEVEFSTKKGIRAGAYAEYQEEGVLFPFRISDNIEISPDYIHSLESEQDSIPLKTGKFPWELILMQGSFMTGPVKEQRSRPTLTFHRVSEWKQPMNSTLCDSLKGQVKIHSISIR